MIFFFGVLKVLVAHQSVPVGQRGLRLQPLEPKTTVHFGSPFGAIAQVGGALSNGKGLNSQVKDLKERARLVVSVSATYGHTTARNVGFRRILPQRPAGTSNWSLVAHIFIGNGNLKHTPDTKV